MSGDNQKYIDSLKELEAGFIQLGDGFNKTIDGFIGEMESILSDEDLPKFKELLGRRMAAEMEGNSIMSNSIDADIKDTFSKYEKPESK
jgi:hypothetical protein